jgi:alpha-glucosidase (family GH31 glycosyl hydrolase)
MPIMRSLWLHYPEDPLAAGRGDQYLWGRDVLVAPITEPSADKRLLYLPKGAWYDYWTGERIDGGREITRGVDLETMPIYVRAGAILPLGPVKQYTAEKSDEPLSISVYPGADGEFLLYEDDGKSFNYRKGEWIGVRMKWNDAKRVLTLELAKGSRMLAPARREIEVKVQPTSRTVHFEGKRLEVKL